jgi:hypothetical protein
VVEARDGGRPVRGDDAVTVVADVFQRVIERGAVTDADIAVAVEREDVTETQIERLRGGWLRSD